MASMAWLRSPKYVEMTFRQTALLSLLCDEPGRLWAGELARRLNLKKPVVSRIINAFCVAGLARRIPDCNNGRSVVEPTVRGRSVRKAMRELATTSNATDIAKAAMAWLHSAKYIDMTFRQAALLSVLCDEVGPHRGRYLAKSLGLERWVVSGGAKRLEALALARRVPGLDDRRSVVIEVTALGRSLREAMKGSP
jgi:DNA-binding MarR family transcriptional regulator